MKKRLLIGAGAAILLALQPSVAVGSASKMTSQAQVTDVTGCLQPGPMAKEYLVQAQDGTVWGVNENDRDLRLNNYVGRTVTIAGETERVSKAEKKAGGASHYLYARDVVVDGDSCKQ